MPTPRPVVPSGVLAWFDPTSPTHGRALEHVCWVAARRGRRASQNLARRDRLHHRRIAPPGGPGTPSQPLAAAPALRPGRSGGLDLDLDVDAGRQVETLEGVGGVGGVL